MPRLVNRHPSYRKHKASGQAIVTLNGEDAYLGPYGTKASRAEYDRVIAEWLGRGKRSAATAEVTVAELRPTRPLATHVTAGAAPRAIIVGMVGEAGSFAVGNHP